MMFATITTHRVAADFCSFSIHLTRSIFLAGLTFLLSIPVAVAEPAATIIVENAVIFERGGDSDNEQVNLIIKDGKLSEITREGLPDNPGIPVFDAKGGFLIGKLAVGEEAGFLIFDSNPGENIRILLDTDTYVVFAIADGEVERNRLRRILDPDQSETPTTWFSYSPPPFSVPGTYRDGDKWNHVEIGTSKHFLTGALVVDRTRWESQSDANKLQVGEIREFDQADVRALRFGLYGLFDVKGKPWTYTIAGATNAFSQGFDTREINDFTFFDVRLDLPIYGKTLSLGKQKEPQSLERGTGMVYLPFQERSMAADALMPSRNTGIVLSDTAFDNQMSWAAGVFNDWLDTGGSRSDSASQFITRVTGIPFRTEDESNLLHLGVGYRYSNSKEGFTTGATPEIESAPEFLDTGALFEADDMVTWNYELGWRKGPYWLMAEYTSTELADTPYGDLSFSGYNIAASFIVTGEMRPYNHKSGTFRAVPIAKPVNAGGLGALELGLRYSTLDLSDNGLQGGEADVYTIAANWWLRSDVLFSINLQRVVLDRPAMDTTSPVLTGRSTGLVARLLLILE